MGIYCKDASNSSEIIEFFITNIDQVCVLGLKLSHTFYELLTLTRKEYVKI